MTTTDSTQTIAKAASRFFSGTMLSRISGLLRDVSMAFVFGTSSSVAAFMMAFRFAHLLRRLLGEGPMQSAFIPYYEGLRKENSTSALAFFRDLIASVTSLICIITLVTISGLTAWLFLGHPDESTREIVLLTILMLPSLLFICLFGLNMGLLQCERSYFIPSFAPVAFNVIWIIGVWQLRHLSSLQAMPYLSIIVVVACLAQWMMTMPKIRSLRNSTGTLPPIHIFSPHVRKLLKPLSLGILGVAASQVNNATDTIFARYADVEGPAQLWYAIRIQQLPLALFGIALSGALLPPLSRAIKHGEMGQFVTFFGFALERTLLLMIPLTIGSFFFGGEIINLIYGHGGFSSEASLMTTYCFWGYMLGLIPMTLTLIFAPALYAKNNYSISTIASIVSMVLNAVLNYAAIFLLGWGSASVAVATSISAWVNMAQLGKGVSDRVEGAFKTNSLLLDIWSALKTSLTALVVAFLGCQMAGLPLSFFSLVMGHPFDFSRNFGIQLISLIFPALLFISVVYLMGRWSKREPISEKTT